MPSVTAISAPKSDKEQVVFYRRKWQASKDEIETKNKRIEHLVKQWAEANNQVTEGNKAIKYLL